MTKPVTKKQALETEGPKIETNRTAIAQIVNRLNTIPKVNGKYSLPSSGNSFTLKIDDKKDAETFAKLHPLYSTKNTGNGEIALFWLFNCQTAEHTKSLIAGTPKVAHVNQGGDDGADPDLQVGSQFLEVKATGNNFDQAFSLGRFGRFIDFINLVGLLQGFEVAFGEQNLDRDVTTLKNVNYPGLVDAAEVFCEVRSVVKSNNLSKYKFFDNLVDKFDRFDDICDKHEILKKCKYGGNVKRFRPGGEEIAKRVLAFLCETVIKEKPGDGNWIIQVPRTLTKDTTSVSMDCFRPQVKNIKLDSMMDKTAFKIENESIKIKFKKVFG